MSHPDLTIQPPTILGSWVLLIAQTVNSYGIDSHRLFKDAGIDMTDFKSNDARFPSSMMAQAWQNLILKTQDPYIGVRIAQLFKPSVFSALGIAMAGSRNIYEAMERCTRYSHFVSEGTITSMEEDEHQVAFVLSSNSQFQSLTHIYGISATLCCLLKIFREVAGESLKIKEVHFEQTLESKEPFEQFFGCPVHYGSNSNKIVIDKKQACIEQSFINTELISSLDGWVETQISKLKKHRLSTRIKKYLLEHLPHGEVDQAKVASDQAMCIRMLQRKLSKEGTTYKKILNEFRKDHAIKLIVEDNIPLSQISVLLGFNDQSNFTRAFKRWTGQTPNKYR